MTTDTARSRRSRIAATAVVAIAAVFAFASLGGIDLAHGVISIAQYQYGKKVTICHKNKNTITISVNAWPAHQRHGDTIGPCLAPSSKKSPGKGKKGSGSTSTGRQSTTTTGNGKGNGNGNGNGQGKGKNK